MFRKEEWGARPTLYHRLFLVLPERVGPFALDSCNVYPLTEICFDALAVLISASMIKLAPSFESGILVLSGIVENRVGNRANFPVKR